MGTNEKPAEQTTDFSALDVGGLFRMEGALWRIVQRTDRRFYIERASRPPGTETPRWIYRHKPKQAVEIFQK